MGYILVYFFKKTLTFLVLVTNPSESGMKVDNLLYRVSNIIIIDILNNVLTNVLYIKSVL